MRTSKNRKIFSANNEQGTRIFTLGLHYSCIPSYNNIVKIFSNRPPVAGLIKKSSLAGLIKKCSCSEGEACLPRSLQLDFLISPAKLDFLISPAKLDFFY